MTEKNKWTGIIEEGTRRKARGYVRTDTSSRLIKVIRRLTNGEESRGTLWTGRPMHILHSQARADDINERDTKKGSKKYTVVKAKSLDARIIDARG